MVLSQNSLTSKKSDIIVWYYTNLSKQITYPSNPVSGDCSRILYVTPTNHSQIKLLSLVSDLDGNGGIPADGYIRFFIQYVKNDNSRNDYQVLSIKYGDYQSLDYIDGQGSKKHIYIDHEFYLKNISGYKDIRLISIGMQYNKDPNGFECVLVANYEQ